MFRYIAQGSLSVRLEDTAGYIDDIAGVRYRTTANRFRFTFANWYTLSKRDIAEETHSHMMHMPWRWLGYFWTFGKDNTIRVLNINDDTNLGLYRDLSKSVDHNQFSHGTIFGSLSTWRILLLKLHCLLLVPIVGSQLFQIKCCFRTNNTSALLNVTVHKFQDKLITTH